MTPDPLPSRQSGGMYGRVAWDSTWQLTRKYEAFAHKVALIQQAYVAARNNSPAAIAARKRYAAKRLAELLATDPFATPSPHTKEGRKLHWRHKTLKYINAKPAAKAARARYQKSPRAKALAKARQIRRRQQAILGDLV